MVWVISGRDQETLNDWLGHIPRLGLSAEHGCFLKYPFSKEWKDLTEGMDMSWQKDVMDVFNYFSERTQGSFVEKKKCSIAWHYRLADPDYGAFQANECRNVLEDGVLSNRAVEILTGKRNLEVRPMALNKGSIVMRLFEERNNSTQHLDSPFDFILCVGDDRTDEDMFRVLQQRQRAESAVQDEDPAIIGFEQSCGFNDSKTWCVTIGHKAKKTLASWHIPSPRDFVSALAECVD